MQVERRSLLEVNGGAVDTRRTWRMKTMRNAVSGVPTQTMDKAPVLKRMMDIFMGRWVWWRQVLQAGCRTRMTSRLPVQVKGSKMTYPKKISGTSNGNCAGWQSGRLADYTYNSRKERQQWASEN
jgi:hypothetical protein